MATGGTARLGTMTAINGVRIAITLFVLVLLVVVVLGLGWTASHQAPRLRTASQIVLAISGLAGIFALGRIWSR
jgi:hypothetical protein